MQPKRPIGFDMDMMEMVIDQQMQEEFGVRLQVSPEELIVKAQDYIEERQEEFENTARTVFETINNKSKMLNQFEDFQKVFGENKDYEAIELQINNLQIALDDQKKLFGEAAKTLAITRQQLVQTKIDHQNLTIQVQNLRAKVKMPKTGPHTSFLNELGKKSATYAADPNHHRYDKYKTQENWKKI